MGPTWGSVACSVSTLVTGAGIDSAIDSDETLFCVPRPVVEAFRESSAFSLWRFVRWREALRSGSGRVVV